MRAAPVVLRGGRRLDILNLARVKAAPFSHAPSSRSDRYALRYTLVPVVEIAVEADRRIARIRIRAGTAAGGLRLRQFCAPDRIRLPSAPESSPCRDGQSRLPGRCGRRGGVARTISLQDPAGSGDYQFDQSELSFANGEWASFTITSENEFHTFTVEALDIDVSVDGRVTETLGITFEEAASTS